MRRMGQRQYLEASVMIAEQEAFWKGDFGKNYMQRNNVFDRGTVVKGWREMLKKTGPVSSILECGSNLGRNLVALKEIYPAAALSLIEINEEAYKAVCASIRPAHSFNGAIADSRFSE